MKKFGHSLSDGKRRGCPELLLCPSAISTLSLQKPFFEISYVLAIGLLGLCLLGQLKLIEATWPFN